MISSVLTGERCIRDRSLGIGALAIFGSYIGKEYTLGGEALRVGVLDTFVAFTAGLIIFPACFAFDLAPDSGPNLIFICLLYTSCGKRWDRG